MRKDDAQAIIAKALALAKAEHCEVTLTGANNASTRFSNNAITQNIAKTDATLTVLSAYGQTKGKAATNDFSDAGIASCVQRAEEIAKHSAPDTEYLPPVPQPAYQDVKAHYPATGAFTPDDRAKAIRESCGLCEKAGLALAGSYANDTGFVAVGNSKGLFAYWPFSDARFISTVLTGDSSGWAESVSNDVAQVNPLTATGIAKQKAEAARNPVAVEPRKYTVILEPAAAAEMILFMLFSMDAKAAHEGRNGFAGKENTPIASPLITLRNRPDHPGCPGSPFLSGDWEWVLPVTSGMQVPETTWIEKGVLRSLMYSRFWAGKTGHAYTGMPSNLILEGSDASLEEMIAAVDDGLLVTRFWYIRYVDPMTMLFTGMTRDGLFRIEKGKVTRGVKNMRFNESPLAMLKNTVKVGKAVRTGIGLPNLTPPLLVKDFTFTSGTSF
jgi:predicted Zn-dependent protease